MCLLLVHGIRKDSPADYAVIKGFVIDYLFANGHNVEHMVDDIKAKWGNKVASYEDCIEEIVCNAMMSIATDENAMQKALKVAHANENILDKIAQAFNNLVSKIKEYLFKFRDNKAAKIFAKDVETLEQLAEMFNEAAENAKAATTEQKNNTVTNDGVKFSVERTLNMSWDKQILSALNKDGFIKRNDTIVVENKPYDFLLEENLSDLPLAIPLRVLTKAKSGKDKSHSIKDDNLMRLQNGMKNAPIVIDNPSRNSLVFITDIKQDDKPILIAFSKNAEFDGDKVHQATSIHLQMSVLNLLNGLREDATIYLKNKKELDSDVGVTNNLRSLASQIKFIDEILSQSKLNVNPKFSVDDTINTDTEYLTAVNNGDMEAAQHMVSQAAKKAGYDSPILYHGTKSFGFTEFDLDKMDDKRSIFLTDSKKIASTYSGVEGIRRISENYDFDIDSLSPKNVVSKLNLLMDKLHKDNSEYAKYQFIDNETVDKLSDTLSKDIEYLKDIVYKKKTEYKSDGKIYSQLSGLFSKLDNQEYTNLSTPIYMLLHHTDVFKNENSDKIADIEKNIRLFNKVRFIDVSDGVILRDRLDGYSLDILYNTEAKEELKALTLQGNYSMYGNLEGALVLDAKGAYWNNIKNWFSNIRLDYDNTKVAREDDEFFYLIDKRIGEAIPESWLDVNEHTKNMTENQLQTLMLNKANESLRFKTENIRTTRDIAKFAEDHGYNGVVFKNLADNGGQNSSVKNDELSNVYIFFSSSQIKSADPVTYDDDGNIIPLSERFKVEQSDIRYSIDDSFNDWLDDAVPQGIDFDKVLEINPTVALATVYRSAAKTTESGLAQSKGVDLDGKAFLSIARKVMQRYELFTNIFDIYLCLFDK